MLPEDGDDALPQVGGLELEEQLAVMVEREVEVVVDERHAVELLLDVGHFDVVGLEEVAAGWHVEEEVLDGHRGAVGGGDDFVGPHLGALYEHERAGFTLGGLGLQLHVGNGGDGGHGLAAEPLGGDVEQVVGRAQLGGGVPLEAETGVVERHALAVVDDLYQGAPGILDDELDVGGPGVNGVFEKFLDHGGGTLHHLAGSDLVGHCIGQEFDDIHRLAVGFWSLF